MTCDGCIGVEEVYVSLRDGQAIVKADDNVDPEELEKLYVVTKTPGISRNCVLISYAC